MKNIAKHLRGVLQCLLFLGMSVQIGFGLIWTFQNIGEKPIFSGMGIAVLEKYYIVVYLIQLLCAFGTGYYFLQTIRKGKDSKWLYVFGGAALVTIPQALQCHLAVLPYSLMSSALLMLLAFAMKLLDRKKALLSVAVTCLTVAIFMASSMVPAYTGADKAVAKEHTIIVSMVSRFCWPFLGKDFYNLEENLKDQIGAGLMTSTIQNADRVAQELYPTLLASYGNSETDNICKQLIVNELNLNTKKQVEYIAQDMLAYHFPAVFVPLQLQGWGYDSVSSRNYMALTMYSPQVAKHWINFWEISFVLNLVASALLLCMDKLKISWSKIFVLLLPLEVNILCYTMQGAGLVDYKKTVIVTLVVYAVFFYCMLGRGENIFEKE